MKNTSLLLLCLSLVPALGAAEPAQIELANQVIKLSDIGRGLAQMESQIQQMAAQALNPATPNQTPAQKEATALAMGKVSEIAAESAKSLQGKLGEIYADIYSEAELKAMLVFFESTEGQAMLSKQPLVMQRLMPLVQAMQQDLMPKVQSIIKAAKAAEANAANPTPTVPAPVTPAPSATSAPASLTPPSVK